MCQQNVRSPQLEAKDVGCCKHDTDRKTLEYGVLVNNAGSLTLNLSLS